MRTDEQTDMTKLIVAFRNRICISLFFNWKGQFDNTAQENNRSVFINHMEHINTLSGKSAGCLGVTTGGTYSYQGNLKF
jgi:hypothetical protein